VIKPVVIPFEYPSAGGEEEDEDVIPTYYADYGDNPVEILKNAFRLTLGKATSPQIVGVEFRVIAQFWNHGTYDGTAQEGESGDFDYEYASTFRAIHPLRVTIIEQFQGLQDMTKDWPSLEAATLVCDDVGMGEYWVDVYELVEVDNDRDGQVNSIPFKSERILVECVDAPPIYGIDEGKIVVSEDVDRLLTDSHILQARDLAELKLSRLSTSKREVNRRFTIQSEVALIPTRSRTEGVTAARVMGAVELAGPLELVERPGPPGSFLDTDWFRDFQTARPEIRFGNESSFALRCTGPGLAEVEVQALVRLGDGQAKDINEKTAIEEHQLFVAQEIECVAGNIPTDTPASQPSVDDSQDSSPRPTATPAKVGVRVEVIKIGHAHYYRYMFDETDSPDRYNCNGDYSLHLAPPYQLARPFEYPDEALPDPDPEGCGFGRTSEFVKDGVVVTSEGLIKPEFLEVRFTAKVIGEWCRRVLSDQDSQNRAVENLCKRNPPQD
jgi:hypothetical protein